MFALFPNNICDNSGNVLSYQHIGQHSAADYHYCISKSRPAKEAEYLLLFKELESLGYSLEVCKRRKA